MRGHSFSVKQISEFFGVGIGVRNLKKLESESGFAVKNLDSVGLHKSPGLFPKYM